MMDLSGNRFGHWYVLPSFREESSGEKKWLCRCDCGTERYVLERSLKYGGSKSCGCITKKRVKEARSHRLEGQVFSDLKVLHKSEQERKGRGVWWTCECSCGKICDVLGTLLVTGRKTHCGCKTKPKNYYYVDISGKKFNMITALEPVKRTTKKGNIIWRCRCDCGNEFEASYNNIVYSNLKSCGCQRERHNSKLHSYLIHVNGTSVDYLKSKKIPANNTSGEKGIYFIKGRWVAKIVFQQKQYYLGKYENKQDAVAARKDAEKLLFDGSVEHYERWKEKAEAEPAWAEENPIEIIVKKKDVGELEVTFLPELV